jgi:Mg2+ and Co2+ transporter CorA
VRDKFGRSLDTSGDPPDDRGMEQRLTALEARLDTILPTLATKADVAEIRVDMNKMNAEIKTWTLATVLTIIGTMLAAIFGIATIFNAASQGSRPQPAPIIITLPAASTPSKSP